MNETVLWKMVLGDSIPRPSGFRGSQGCSASTAKLNTNIVVLKMSKEAVYCFQFCWPLSRCPSTQRRKRGALYCPFMIQAKYRLERTPRRRGESRMETV